MTRARKHLGEHGERYVARMLADGGWHLIDTNWRGAAGEVDIIADDGQAIVFVEVKTRRGESMGRAEESITPAKARRLLELASEYVSLHPGLDGRYWRIDLAALTLDRSGRIVRYSHIRDACLDE